MYSREHSNIRDVSTGRTAIINIVGPYGWQFDGCLGGPGLGGPGSEGLFELGHRGQVTGLGVQI